MNVNQLVTQSLKHARLSNSGSDIKQNGDQKTDLKQIFCCVPVVGLLPRVLKSLSQLGLPVANPYLNFS